MSRWETLRAWWTFRRRWSRDTEYLGELARRAHTAYQTVHCGPVLFRGRTGVGPDGWPVLYLTAAHHVPDVFTGRLIPVEVTSTLELWRPPHYVVASCFNLARTLAVHEVQESFTVAGFRTHDPHADPKVLDARWSAAMATLP